MTPLFKKLNFKQQNEIYILNHPSEFEAEMNAMKGYTTIRTNMSDSQEIEFVITFVKTKADIEIITPDIHKKLKGDGIVWFAYPKGTSKKYKAEINRDNGWDLLGKSGLVVVSAVAIDDDWTALRFRRIEFIKTMTRKK